MVISLIDIVAPHNQAFWYTKSIQVIRGLTLQLWCTTLDGISIAGFWHAKNDLKCLCHLLALGSNELYKKSLPYTGSDLCGLSFSPLLVSGQVH